MDEIDRADAEIERSLAEAIRQAGRDLKPGTPGECHMCDEWCGRLIGGACARCRDKYKLP